jgi:hypothetical protein
LFAISRTKIGRRKTGDETKVQPEFLSQKRREKHQMQHWQGFQPTPWTIANRKYECFVNGRFSFHKK